MTYNKSHRALSRQWQELGIVDLKEIGVGSKWKETRAAMENMVVQVDIVLEACDGGSSSRLGFDINRLTIHSARPHHMHHCTVRPHQADERAAAQPLLDSQQHRYYPRLHDRGRSPK
jgi:hypothetical protein